MGFGWPPGLAALAAVIVPILIHLSTRRPRRAVRVGTLQHLEGSPRRRARSRLTEPALLAVRLLVLVLLALFLAQPYLHVRDAVRTPRSIVVLPAAHGRDSLGDSLRAVVDSLLAAGAELRAMPMADLWSELAELDAGRPAGSALTVIAPDPLPLSGTRPALRSSVALHRIAAPATIRAPDRARRTLRVMVAGDSAHAHAIARAAAALRAVADMRGDSLLLLGASGHPGSDSWLVWLADSAPPAEHLDSIRAGATLLTGTAGDIAGLDRIEARRVGRGLAIAATAMNAPALDATFPEFIARIWPDPSALAPRAPAARRISTGQLMPAAADGRRPDTPPRRPITGMLLLAAAAAFLIERGMAHRRRAEIAA